jgi:signal-transduction protein with cAMP-binding, CBS, and nucleotidyltransferase domain
MTLRDILAAKGAAIQTIGPEATLEDVVHQLNEHNIGSLVVIAPSKDAPCPAGIITERDILHACAVGDDLAATNVSKWMTTELITGSPSDAVPDIMGLMTQKRIRHLPVLEEGRLVGIISIGDVVKAQHDQLAMENQFMRRYIQTER